MNALSGLLTSGAKNDIVLTSVFLVVIGYAYTWISGILSFLAYWLASFLVSSVTYTWKDISYDWFRQWLADSSNIGVQAHSIVHTTNQGRSTYADDSMSEITSSLAPAPGYHLLRLNRRLVLLCRYAENSELSRNPSQDSVTIYVFGLPRSTIPYIKKLVSDVKDHHENPPRDKTRVFTATTSCAWEVSTSILSRPVDSVIWKRGCAEKLFEDAERFYASRSWYFERGLSHRRGYLFHGPPGNGKSSMVAALATKLGFGVASVSLSDCESDYSLKMLFSNLPQKTLLLIEDIDVAFGRGTTSSRSNPKTKTKKRATKVTMSGLLNAIDGIGASENRILIMTTNHPDNLDAALIRAARIDLKFYVGPVDGEQAERMFSFFFKDSKGDIEGAASVFRSRIRDPVCGGVIQNYFIDRRESMERARDETNQLYGTEPLEMSTAHENPERTELRRRSNRETERDRGVI